VESRLTPEQAFSHPFVARAVQELKGMRATNGQQNDATANNHRPTGHVQPTPKKEGSNNSMSETTLPQIVKQ
jgi:hypothetical protein